MCKYSFVIPVYNCAEFLEQCVQSIINQHESDLEIILVDDGSTDNSGELCDKLSDKYSQVKTFHKKNGGAASARNIGIDNAKGKYIVFVDGDDTLDSSFLSEMKKATDENDCDLIVFGMSFDYYNKGILQKSDVLSCKYSGLHTHTEYMNSFESLFNDNCLSSACNKVFLSHIIKDNDLRFKEEMNLYEDFEFVLCYMNHMSKMMMINKPFYHYRHNISDNHLYSRVKDISKLRRNLHMLLKTMSELKEGNESSLNVAVNLYMSLLVQHLMYHKFSYTSITKVLPEYCNDVIFRKIIDNGGKLNAKEQELLSLIDNKSFCKIYLKFKIKKIKSRTKKSIKRFLIALRVKK